MSLSKKHFRAIASILRDTRASKTTKQEIARYFASENPRFDFDRFYTASTKPKAPRRKKTEMGMSLSW